MPEFNHHPRPGFSTRKAAESAWYDSMPGRNDRSRYVKDGGRWYIEEFNSWSWTWNRWDASEYVPLPTSNNPTSGSTSPVQ